MTDVACFAAAVACPDVTMTEPSKLGGDFEVALGLPPFREPIVDCDRATFDPAELAQVLHERGKPSRG